MPWERVEAFLNDFQIKGDDKEKKAFDDAKTKILSDIKAVETDIANATLSAKRLASSKVSASFWVKLINNKSSIKHEILSINRSENQPQGSKVK